MCRAVLLSLWLSLSWASFAAAEDTSPKQTAEEQWLAALRGSSSYREGQSNIRRLVEAGYDEGAIAGASQWDDLREYYISLARAKGCEHGTPYVEGPVKACHRSPGAEPPMIGRDYDEGLRKVVQTADDTRYPELVRRILEVLFDYGYVQGLKHGLRSNNADIRWRQAFYKSCVARANDAKGEAPCAAGSKEWADSVLVEVEKRIDAHGLTAAQKK